MENDVAAHSDLENIKFFFVGTDITSCLGNWLTQMPDNVSNRSCNVVLITIVAINGRSPYPVGTQMALNLIHPTKAEYCGYLTSGCAEHAILFRAIEQLKRREIALETYGRGSKYIDIVLPCGSGITVLIDPCMSVDLLQQVVELKKQRRPFIIKTPLEQGEHGIETKRYLNASEHPCVYLDGVYEHQIVPAPKLLIAGQGPIVSALSSLAQASGFYVDAYYDDMQTLAETYNLSSFKTQSLKAAMDEMADPYCAFITLFHEHEKEIALLKQALNKPFFYIGALGSKTSHSSRLIALSEQGVTEDKCRLIKGPIGVEIGASTPEHIAVSILAEVIQSLGN